jgi:hypothetical protein
MPLSLSLSLRRLYLHAPCRLDHRLRELGRVPEYDEEVPIETCWALPSTSTMDMLWSLCGSNDRVMAGEIALLAARGVLARHPSPLWSETVSRFANMGSSQLYVAVRQYLEDQVLDMEKEHLALRDDLYAALEICREARA